MVLQYLCALAHLPYAEGSDSQMNGLELHLSVTHTNYDKNPTGHRGPHELICYFVSNSTQ